MKKSIKILAPVFFLFALQSQVIAQTSTLDQKIDKIYEDLRISLKELKSEKMAAIYTDDSRFLAFEGKIGNGKVEWMPGIVGWFKEVAEKGDKIDTRFQIEKRLISDGLVVDVGYFYATRAGSKTEKSCGKMVNVFIKNKNNKGEEEWKFTVDMSSGAPISEFDDINGDVTVTRKK